MQIEKSIFYQTALERQYNQLLKRKTFLDKKPTYQTELLQGHLQIDEQCEALRVQIKNLFASQKYFSYRICK